MEPHIDRLAQMIGIFLRRQFHGQLQAVDNRAPFQAVVFQLGLRQLRAVGRQIMGRSLAVEVSADRVVGQILPVHRWIRAHLDAQVTVQRLLGRIDLSSVVPIAVRADAPNLHQLRIVFTKHETQLLARGKRIVADLVTILFPISGRKFRHVLRQMVVIAIVRIAVECHISQGTAGTE